MALDPITAISDLIKTGLEKWLPDASIREQAAAQIAAQVHAQTMAQIEVNKVEAASQSLFVAGWRPWVGWTCGAAYAYTFVIQPFLLFLLTALQVHVDIAQLPVLDMGELGVVLFGMLGLGAMRSYEKVKGNGK
jgi:hypothetical protein